MSSSSDYLFDFPSFSCAPERDLLLARRVAATRARETVEDHFSSPMGEKVNWSESCPGEWVAEEMAIRGCTRGCPPMFRGLRIIWIIRVCVVNKYLCLEKRGSRNNKLN